MASITPYKNKDGVIVSYRFRACVGRDELGKQQFATKTVKLTDKEGKLTPKKLEAEMQRQADNWEKDILAGRVPVKRNMPGRCTTMQTPWRKAHTTQQLRTIIMQSI